MFSLLIYSHGTSQPCPRSHLDSRKSSWNFCQLQRAPGVGAGAEPGAAQASRAGSGRLCLLLPGGRRQVEVGLRPVHMARSQVWVPGDIKNRRARPALAPGRVPRGWCLMPGASCSCSWKELEPFFLGVLLNPPHTDHLISAGIRPATTPVPAG